MTLTKSLFHSPRRGTWATLGAALAVLVACSPSSGEFAVANVSRIFNSPTNPQFDRLEAVSQYQVVPATRSMVHAPDAVLILERNLDGALDQRVILPNDTAVRGDNEMRVRAQTAASNNLTEFNFAETVARFGGLPAPFEALSPAGLNTGTDAVGSFVYAQQTMGVDTVCVLALRRIGVGARPLPAGTRALDVMMRNCVRGDAREALAPFGDRSVAIGGIAQGNVLTLSPHAAPRR